MKSKPFLIILLILVSLSFAGVVFLFLLMNKDDDALQTEQSGTVETRSADEIVESVVEIPEMTTNLANGDLIKISFSIQADSKETKEEVEKLLFQVKNIIISDLSETSPEQLSGKEGQEQLQALLKSNIDSILQEGKVDKVYVTSLIIP